MPSLSEARTISASCSLRSGFAVRGVWLLILLSVLFGTEVCAQQSENSSVVIPLKVLRYRNITTGAHAFTTDPKGKQSLPGAYSQETGNHLTSDSPFFYLYTEKYGESVPIYRFQDSNGAMTLVASEEERKMMSLRGLREVAEPVYVYKHCCPAIFTENPVNYCIPA
jgi:hypothetical protein